MTIDYSTFEVADVTGANFRAEGESKSGKCDSSFECLCPNLIR
jgi:hypothetical protein